MVWTQGYQLFVWRDHDVIGRQNVKVVVIGRLLLLLFSITTNVIFDQDHNKTDLSEPRPET